MIGIEINAREITDLVDEIQPRHVTYALKRAAKDIGDMAIALYEKTTSTWTDKPEFEAMNEAHGEGAYMVVGTPSPIYTYVDEGTGIYGPTGQPYLVLPKKPGGVLRFFAYKAKTRPGSLVSRAGGPYGPPIFARYAIVKGIEPRHFSEQITKRITKKIPETVFWYVMDWWYREHPGQQMPGRDIE